MTGSAIKPLLGTRFKSASPIVLDGCLKERRNRRKKKQKKELRLVNQLFFCRTIKERETMIFNLTMHL